MPSVTRLLTRASLCLPLSLALGAAPVLAAGTASRVHRGLAAKRHGPRHPGRQHKGRWAGQSLPDGSTRFTFSVGAGRISRLLAPAVGCSTVSGYTTIPVADSASTPIASNGGFDAVWHPIAGVTDEFKGHFTSVGSARGTLQQTGRACSTGQINWIARSGGTPPPLPAKPTAPSGSTAPSCTASACPASNGLTIHVSDIDRAITSPNHPESPYYGQDLMLANTGGVKISISATNASSSEIVLDPLYHFRLRLSDGSVVSGHDSSGYYVSGASGGPYDCQHHSESVVPGASSAPVAVCFVVPADRRTGLTLLYQPDGTNLLASIPLS